MHCLIVDAIIQVGIVSEDYRGEDVMRGLKMASFWFLVGLIKTPRALLKLHDINQCISQPPDSWKIAHVAIISHRVNETRKWPG